MAPGPKDNCNWLRRAVYNRTIGHPSRLSFPLLKGLFMPAYKALFMLIVVGAIAALGVFYFIPSLRPAFVEAWFQKASGFTPAQSPDEALDKFRNAIKARL